MPHILLPRLADEPRVVRGRGNPLTIRNQEVHGRRLLNQLEAARRQFERQRAVRPDVLMIKEMCRFLLLSPNHMV